jgi:O-antigen/teichoic acid export membrane protein
VNRFARLRHKNKTKALRRTIMVLLAFATICSIAGLLLTDFAGEWILGFVFGPQFVSAQGLLMIIALTICTRLYGVIPQSMLHAERRFKTFLFREIAAVLVCVGLLTYCIPRWGLMGAGYAILAASVFRLVVMIFAIKLAPPRPLSEESLAQGLEQPA